VLRFEDVTAVNRNIEVLDVVGRVVMKIETSSPVQVLDLSRQASGIYSVRICESGDCTARKLILNK
jgi:Secretion system C-terminal sorting domain